MSLKEELKKLRNGLWGKLNQTTAKRSTVVKSELTEEEKMMFESVDKFREEFKSPVVEAMTNDFASIRNVNLDGKVDNFIDVELIK